MSLDKLTTVCMGCIFKYLIDVPIFAQLIYGIMHARSISFGYLTKGWHLLHTHTYPHTHANMLTHTHTH